MCLIQIMKLIMLSIFEPSFIRGDISFIQRIDDEYSRNVVDKKGGKYYVIKDSDHNLQMDNPVAFANCIINDLLGLDLPFLGLEE